MKAKSIMAVAGAAAIAFLITNRHLKQKYDASPEMIPDETPPTLASLPTQPEQSFHPVSIESNRSPIVESPQAISDHYSLNIEKKYLEAARPRIAILKVALSQAQERVNKAARSTAPDTEAESGKLALRLGLDPDAKERLNAVLSAHAKKEIQYDAIKARQSMRRLKAAFLGNEQDDLYCTALQAKLWEGEALTDEERAFYEEYKAHLTKQIEEARLKYSLSEGSNQEKPVDPGSWYENQDTLAALREQLTQEQQAELNVVVEENITRDREQTAYKRTNMLTETLGLSEADRAALYKYLYENPDASNSDIAEQLSPELRDLVPRDDPPNTTTYHYPDRR